MASGDDACEVQRADEAVYGLADIVPDAVYQRIGAMLKVLGSYPYYGEEYDPYYKAARPAVGCRVLFVGRYGVYYTVDDDARIVTVLAIQSSRRNPKSRFGSTSPAM